MAVVLVVLAIVAGRFVERPRAVEGGDFERFHDGVFRVVKVVDGDTIDIDAPSAGLRTTRIRLWGVDTPEVAGSPRGAMHFGAEASAFAKSAVMGKRVQLELLEHETRDKFGRLLAYVFVEGESISLNEGLIRTGHGYADSRFDHPWLTRFMAAESAAMAEDVGLWRDVEVDGMPGWRQRDYRGGRGR